MIGRRRTGIPDDAAVTAGLSRLGLHVAFITAFAVLGGALRGFNLLLIVSGLLVAALVLQWRLCRRIARSLEVSRIAPNDASAGKPFTLHFEIVNRSRWVPAWLVMLDDAISPAVDDAARKTVVARCGVGLIAPAGRQECQYQCLIHQRGRYRLGPTRLSTGFPFGFSTARRTLRSPQSDLFVYPPLLKLNHRWEQILASRSGGLATSASRSGISEGDFYGLREWQHGDSQRWIHWRTTARLGEVAVRQFEQLRRHEMCLLLDTSRAEPLPASDTDEAFEAALERAIELTATLLMQLVRVPSNRVTLVVAGDRLQSMVVTAALASIRTAMRWLSEVESTANRNLAPALASAIETAGGGRPIVLISPHRPDEQRLTDGQRDMDVQHVDLRWLDVRSALFQELVLGGPAHATS